jgi:hypothetical protein
MGRNKRLIDCLVLLVAFLVAPLWAAGNTDEAELAGVISRNDAGRFVLIEEEGGDSVVLESDTPQTLADHENARVIVKGRWSATRETFRVANVTPIPVEPPVG